MQQQQAAIEELVASAAADCHAPGIGWAVVRGGQVVLQGSHGTLEDGTDRPWTTATRSRIASMTKSFTAAAVLVLRDEGALALDDPIAAHLPEVAHWNGPTSDAPAITVRHLLTMAAGMATDDPWGDRHLDADEATMAHLLAATATFAAIPGTRWEYSNLGYAVLGRLVARLTGSTLQTFVTERLLRPLGMDRTGWLPEGGDEAQGHRWVDDHWEPEVPLGDGGFAPMGGLWSTLDDLARWVGFWCDAFPPRDDPDGGPVRRDARREAQQVHRASPSSRQPATATTPERFAAGGYGMGLQVQHDLRFGHLCHHSGGLPGFGSNMRWLPDRGIGAVALANVTYAPMAPLSMRILEVLDDAGALPGPHGVDDSLVAPAAAALVGLLADWDDSRAADLFAANVALDEPFERRRRAAEWLGEELGPLRLATVKALTRTSAELTVAGDRGTRVMNMLLSPEVPPRVQAYWLRAETRP